MIRLSYSHWQAFRSCHAWYKAMVDKTAPPEDDNTRYKFGFGNVMHRISEVFYKARMYNRFVGMDSVRDCYQRLKVSIPGMVDDVFGTMELGVKGRPLTRDEIIVRCEEATKRFLAVVIKHQLFGVYASAEVNLKIQLPEKGLTLFGYLDLVVINRTPKPKCRLGDIKSKRYKELDKWQLIWYSLLWYYKFGIPPDQFVFIYLEGDPDYEPYDYNEREIQELMADILLTRDRINAETQFNPTPNKGCWKCPIKMACKESPYKSQAAIDEELEKREGPISFQSSNDSFDEILGDLGDAFK